MKVIYVIELHEQHDENNAPTIFKVGTLSHLKGTYGLEMAVKDNGWEKISLEEEKF